MDGDDGVLAIVLAAEHLLDFTGVHHSRKLLETGGEIGKHVLALPRPFHQHAHVLGALGERGDEVDLFLDAAAPLKDLLGLGLVVPEIRSGRAGFYAGQFFCGVRGLKDNSGDRTRASPDLDTCE
jgi:hypothetical protein